MHVRRLEAGGIVGADKQAVERTELQTSAPRACIIDVRDVVVLVVPTLQAGCQHAEDRYLELDASRIAIAIASAARTGQGVDLADCRQDARIAVQVVALARGLNHTSERKWPGRQFEQVTRQDEAGGYVARHCLVVHQRRHRTIVLGRDRAVEAIQVQAVNRQAIRNAR